MRLFFYSAAGSEVDYSRGKGALPFMFGLGHSTVLRGALLRLFLSWQILSLGAGEFFELLFAHRLSHLFGSAFEGRLLYFSTLGGKGGSGGHLLFL